MCVIVTRHILNLWDNPGEHKEAVVAFEAAVRLSPGHVTALTGLARALRSLGKNKMAEETFRR